MELWVRSQNKYSLIKVNNLYLNDSNDYLSVNTDLGEYGIIELGEYKTKERALEVLDEIQRIIEPRLKFQEIKTERKLDNNLIDYDLSDAVLHTYQSPVVKELGTYVYEMPEE